MSSSDSLEDYLIQEAKEAHQLIQQSDSRLRKQKDISICYLISRKWFTLWSEYVGYQDIIQGKEPNSDKFCMQAPTLAINGEFLDIQDVLIQSQAGGIVSQLSLMKFDEEKVPEAAYLNIHLGKEQGSTFFKVLDETSWKYFSSRYPGAFDIPRPVSLFNGQMISDIQLLQPDVCIVNEELLTRFRQEKSEIPWMKCNMRGLSTIKQLQQIFERQFSVTKVRILKCESSLKRDELNQQLSKALKGEAGGIRAQELLLDNQFNKPNFLRDFLKNHYSIIIELPIKGQFTLKLSTAKIQQKKGVKVKGVCEYCTKIAELSVNCLCNTVSYCSSNCKYKDQDFHSRSCDVAADSASDEEMSSLPLEVSTKVGLKNIGNTCYLASALQNLYVSKEFSESFTLNQVTPKPNHPGFKLVQKFSKLFKEMAMGEMNNPIEPWSFKTQLSRLHPMFAGNLQHDSCEFLNCLIDVLDDASEKETNQQFQLQEGDLAGKFWQSVISKNFSSASQNSFLGMFENKISCKKCEHSSISYDPFIVLSLPIKKKPVERNIQVNLIKSDIRESVVNIKTTYSTGETSILDLVTKICKDNSLEYNNNIIVCTFNGPNLMESYIKKEQLDKKVEELEQELEGRNKALVLYEVQFDISTFDPIKHKLLKIEFAKLSKVQLGIMTVDGKVTFSVPHIFIKAKNASLSSIYLELFESLKEIYPEYINLVNQRYRPIQKEEEVEVPIQENEKNPQTIVPKSQEVQQTNTNQKQQIINQQPEQIKQASATIGGGWDDQSSIQTVPQKKQVKEQKTTTNVNTIQNNISTQQQPIKNEKTIENTKSQQQPQAQAVTSQPTNQIPQQNQNEKDLKKQAPVPEVKVVNQQQVDTSDGWGEILVVPKKVVTKTQQPQAQKAVQEAPKPEIKEKEEFTQVGGKHPKQQNRKGKKEYYYQKSQNDPNTQTEQQNQQSSNQQPQTTTIKSTIQNNQPQKQQTTEDKSKSNVSTQPQQQTQQKKQQETNSFSGWDDSPLPSSSVSTASSSSVPISAEKPAVQQKIEQKPNVSEPVKNQEDAEQILLLKKKAAAERKIREERERKRIEKEKEQEEIQEMLNQLPILVNIKSQKRKSTAGQYKCLFCNKQNCQNCQLPYDNDKTLSELLGNYRDTFELELFWSLQPESVLNKVIVDYFQSNNQLKKLSLPTLEYCLEEFSKPEELTEENRWDCSVCDKKQNAIKQLDVRYAPNNLIIQLKRFRTNQETGQRDKNSQQVIFPIKDFHVQGAHTTTSPSQSVTTGKIMYELYGVIAHEGTTQQGHYFAHTRTNEQWYCFNDDVVTQIEQDKVLHNKNAYILFYRLQK